MFASCNVSIHDWTSRLTLCPAAQLPDFPRFPAETGQILTPTLILVLQILNRQRLRPSSERALGHWVLQHRVVRLEGNSEMCNVCPFVVHIYVQLAA